MAKPYVYLVETVCQATIRETWLIRSRLPMTAVELGGVLDVAGLSGVTVTCLEDRLSVDEGPRRVVTAARWPPEVDP